MHQRTERQQQQHQQNSMEIRKWSIRNLLFGWRRKCNIIFLLFRLYNWRVDDCGRALFHSTHRNLLTPTIKRKMQKKWKKKWKKERKKDGQTDEKNERLKCRSNFFIGANLMFWQGGFNSRQANFYVNVGNSFAPHINAPGGNGGLHVSYSLSALRRGCSRMQHFTITQFTGLSICMKSAWKIEWNALLCIHNRCIGNIFLSMPAFFEHHTNCVGQSLCSILMHRHISTISALQVNKKNSLNVHKHTCTWTINFWKWLIGVKLLIGQGCTQRQKSRFFCADISDLAQIAKET